MKTLLIGSFADVASPECVFSYGAYKDDDRYLAVLGFKFMIFVIFALVFGVPARCGRPCHSLLLLV